MSQGCVLLLNLKQYLKEAYGFTDAKISRYTPTEQAKVYDKPLNRRPQAKFSPRQVVQVIKEGESPDELDIKQKRQLILAYLDVSVLRQTTVHRTAILLTLFFLSSRCFFRR